jgi:hypothetical protein
MIIVVDIIYRCWFIGWCQSIGRYGGKLLPFCTPWILAILMAYRMTIIIASRVVVVATNLFIPVLALLLFSYWPPLLIIAIIILPYQLYCSCGSS